MKKWIIPIMFMLMVNIAHAGFFTSVNGGESQNNGFFAAVNAWFTTTTCIEDWVETSGQCLTNDTLLKVYTDLSSCGTYTILPSDNGTFSDYCNYCSYNLVINDVTTCIEYDGNKTHNVTVFDSNYPLCCNITGLSSDCYQDDNNAINKTYYETQICRVKFSMYPLGISIFIIGLMFWLIYTANTLNTRNQEGDAVPVNVMIKLIMYGFGGFLSYISIQLAYGYAVSQQLAISIKNTLQVSFELFMNLAVLMLLIILLGVAGNVGMRAFYWFRDRYNTR